MTRSDLAKIPSLLSLCVSLLLLSQPAAARLANAQFVGCTGCHSTNVGGAVAVTIDPPNPDPGALVSLTVVVTAPGIQIGGFSIFNEDANGSFSVPTGQRIAVISGQWAYHSMAQPAADGSVVFRVNWQAPSTPGAANFVVSAVGGNGNSQSSGDFPTETSLQFAYGCSGITYFSDLDADGFGSSSFGTRVDCAKPERYSDVDGDCNENSAAAYPGAPEMCNNRDDDCDGIVDEDIQILPRYPDADGDGYGDITGEPVMDCAAPRGFADLPGDCDDSDPESNPGVFEVCDALDNDCDGEVDDGARATCGTGFCLREAISCFSECVPGNPFPEICDTYDDDCDGEIDEADACPAGQVCMQFECVDAMLAQPNLPATPVEPSDDPARQTAEADSAPSGDVADRGPVSDTVKQARSGCTVFGHPSAERGPLAGVRYGSAAGWLVLALLVRRRRRSRAECA